MHLAFAVCMILAVWKWADWRNWRRYQSTMLYMFSVAMLYEYLTKQYILWEFHTDVPMPHTILSLLYAVIFMPLSVLLYLSRYPEKIIRQIIWYLSWISIYMVIKIILYTYGGRITYEHGWNLWWSLIFDIVMFPMLRLHHTKPLLAYSLSVVIIAGYMIVFKVPLK